MTTKAEILRSIRANCIDCCVGSAAEVRKCHLQECILWPFQFGRYPKSEKLGPRITVWRVEDIRQLIEREVS